MSFQAKPQGVREWLHTAFHRPQTRLYRTVETIVWVLILASVVLFGYEAWTDQLADPPPALRAADRAVLGLFIVELALRLLSYRPPMGELLRSDRPAWYRVQVTGRLRYLMTPAMLIDLATVLAVVPALRVLRAVRLLRLLRGVRIFRYSNPYLGFLRGFEENSLLYAAVFGFLAINVTVGGLMLFLAEVNYNDGVESIGDGLWWALVTLTTVGYGDITPATATGRVVGGALMVGGMFTLAMFAGLVGSTLLNAMLRMKEDQFRMSSYANHIVVCGFDPGAHLLLDSLLAELPGDETDILLFSTQPRPHDLPPDFTFIPGDPTKESELAKVRMRWARAVIVVGSRQLSPGEADARTILTIFTIRSWLGKWDKLHERKQPLYIVAEVLDTENVQHAQTAGADEVIETDRIGFDLLAHAVLAHGSADILSKVAAAGALSVFTGSNPFDKVTTYAQLLEHMRSKYRATALGVRDPAGRTLLNPVDAHPVQPEDAVIYLSERQVLPEE